ncbi:hypothetical protein LH433_02225 [Laribacter hongkongensis]|uniref:hypothetical protein n=1 Tax=Laribacter hongkongensis TaxID=168471 RepID=UPI001EFEEE3B|nr:hypothetical protein [Laribacter hongkongensis]MCG9105572.1 hypothetical protein [Laribacter hongkongensis]
MTAIDPTTAQTMIPPRRHRLMLRHVKTRNPVERFFNRLKQLHYLATRHDKPDHRFSTLLCPVCSCLWLLRTCAGGFYE